MGRTSWYPSILTTSALIVGAWGYGLWQGVHDPRGGINALWPLFGISNQLLATVAFCVATTIIIKSGKARYAWVTLTPLAWLVAATFSASWHKIFDPNPRIGFLAEANQYAAQLPSLPPDVASGIAKQIINDRLDAAITGVLIVLVGLMVLESAREWMRVLSGKKQPVLNEAPFIATRFAPEEA